MSRAESLALIGGDIALDFSNTMRWHASDGGQIETFAEYGELVTWALRLGTLVDAEAALLRSESALHPVRAKRALRRALEHREVIYRIFTALSHNQQPASDDLAALHSGVVDALAAATPVWHQGHLVNDWSANAAVDFNQPLYPLLIAARELLLSDRVRRVRQCDNHPCGWLFVDTSRNGRRRWCSSIDCGNLARVRKFRSK